MKQLISVMLLLAPALVLADNHSGLEDKIKEAMKSDVRTEAEMDRDRNRRPVETLKFFGLKDDMRVLELLPGGGWYTKLLAPALAENGEYYAALGTSRVKDNLVGKPGFESINIVAEDSKIFRPEGSRFYSLESSGLGVTDVDIVFTFRNYHNFSAEGRAAMNKAAYDALKTGGVYAVVDHTRRHMEEDNAENRRRIDPVMAIMEIQQAGFEFVDFSGMHFKADDELRYEVGRKTVTGNTDRFTFKFIKK